MSEANPSAAAAVTHSAKPAKAPKPEIQTRVCTCCAQSYEYPALKSRASRFHCDLCIALPPDARKVFELMNKRLAKLEKAASAAKPAAAPKPAPAKAPAADDSPKPEA